jgi:hypothetical protein
VPLPAPGPPKSMSRIIFLHCNDTGLLARMLLDELLDDARIRKR